MSVRIDHLYQQKYMSRCDIPQSPIKPFPSSSTQIKFQPAFSKQVVKRCEEIFKKIVEGSQKYGGSRCKSRPKSQLSQSEMMRQSSSEMMRQSSSEMMRKESSEMMRKGSAEHARIVHSQGKSYQVLSIPIHSRVTHPRSIISQSNLQPATSSRLQRSSSIIMRKIQQKKDGRTGLMKILLKQFYENKKQRVKKLIAMRQANKIQKDIIKYHKENREDKAKQLLNASTEVTDYHAHSHNFVSRDIRQYHHYRVRNNLSRKDSRLNNNDDQKTELTPWPVSEEQC